MKIQVHEEGRGMALRNTDTPPYLHTVSKLKAPRSEFKTYVVSHYFELSVYFALRFDQGCVHIHKTAIINKHIPYFNSVYFMNSPGEHGCFHNFNMTLDILLYFSVK